MRTYILKFVLVGGLAVPLAFTCSWLLIEFLMAEPRAKNMWLVSVQQVQVMVWPSSVIQMADPQSTFSVSYFCLALGINVGVYAALGAVFWWASKSVHRLIAYWALCSLLLVGLALVWGAPPVYGACAAVAAGVLLTLYWCGSGERTR
jgi:hypothetical protein